VKESISGKHGGPEGVSKESEDNEL